MSREPAQDHRTPARSAWPTVAVAVVGCLAAVIRLTVVLLDPNAILEDPDAYWRYARAIWYRGSYLSSAFRPPVYPLLLAPCWALGDYRWLAAAALHGVLGGVAAGAAGFVAHRVLRTRVAAWGAGLIVAFDPVLVYWSGRAMSETAAAALAAVAMAWLSLGPGQVSALGSGVLAGVTALCRPELGAAVAAAATARYAGPYGRQRVQLLGVILFGIAAVLSIWIARNLRISGHFVPLTTHGGYTAVLGNNPLWYRILEEHGLTARYDGEELRRWQRALQRDFERWLKDEGLSPESRLEREVYYDRFCYERALQSAKEEPRGFVRAAVQRLWALWKPVPSDRYGVTAGILVGAWYGVLYAACVAGLVRWVRSRQQRPWLLAAAALAVTITGVHVVYWCDMRMRSPLIPVLAVLAAASLGRLPAVAGNRTTKQLRESNHGNGAITEDPGPGGPGIAQAM